MNQDKASLGPKELNREILQELMGTSYMTNSTQIVCQKNLIITGIKPTIMIN